RADRRRADLVDRVGADLDRQTGADRRLPRRRLAGAALQHLPHDHVLDLVVLDAGPGERLADHDRPELRRLLVRERTAELRERRTDSGNDHGTAHGSKVPMAAWIEPPTNRSQEAVEDGGIDKRCLYALAMPSPRTMVKRHSERGVYDRAAIDAILDEA